jgi:hypothetical protein
VAVVASTTVATFHHSAAERHKLKFTRERPALAQVPDQAASPLGVAELFQDVPIPVIIHARSLAEVDLLTKARRWRTIVKGGSTKDACRPPGLDNAGDLTRRLCSKARSQFLATGLESDSSQQQYRCQRTHPYGRRADSALASAWGAHAPLPRTPKK